MTLSNYDLLGVGIGPFNLSIAALAAPKQSLKTRFFERKNRFVWHPGLLLSDAKMQTSFLKDLVTAVDPTSEYSFLNYLVKNEKFYPFTARGEFMISRLEFSDYMSWVSNRLPNTQFSSEVESVSFDDDRFVVTVNGQQHVSKHLVVGTGTQAVTPNCAKPHLGEHCFHAQEMMMRAPDLKGKRIAIIGGGQTGADIFQHVFDGEFGQPSHVHWVSRRANLESLDESCFTDQFFMPDYANQFFHLDKQSQQMEVNRQKLASDGITEECLKGIYQRLYHDRYVLKNSRWWNVLPHQELVDMKASTGANFELSIQHGLSGEISLIEADVVIMCTGFSRVLPECLKSVVEKLELDDKSRPILTQDYQAIWKQASSNKLFIVNAGTHNHGIVEPQLSLAAWRAAKIINSTLEQSEYTVTDSASVIDWSLKSAGISKVEANRPQLA
ncbi:SidA/IucD/PvdA family monooxygenase [Vibrio sp. SCSIO 43136]|uniref:lysine N(6)-hydroxylase/L-ornithine N(5)-oxygenase family protein n=1 Tax=Vibrio sp. SCSIO 43136 TaxID=2819101 RepID=UPI002074C406|nr:SidA/IucD/PvdA family monooxygenase [Vibrio sp. SCSIO 43136]USD67624.1 SidA/IucD/PvdA family monooxygenase [Vibrio sp. SCSIO 43136]